jgi:nitroreductase
MEIAVAISGRRSTREYTKQAIDAQTILRLIHAATLAPSAVNQQPWTFTVVRNQNLLDQVSRDAKAHTIATMPAAMADGARTEHFRSMLTPHSMGLGSCWIGFAQSYLNTPAGKRALDLPDSRIPVAPLIVGYQSHRLPRRLH